MGVPTSEVSYTIATTRRETTKVHKNMWWHWEREKKNFTLFLMPYSVRVILLYFEYKIFLSRFCRMKVRPWYWITEIWRLRIWLCNCSVSTWGRENILLTHESVIWRLGGTPPPLAHMYPPAPSPVPNLSKYGTESFRAIAAHVNVGQHFDLYGDA